MTASDKRPLPLPRALADLARSGVRSAALLAHGRIRQPVRNVGRRIGFADGTTATVYRETVIARPAASEPAVLVVCFRLRGVRSERAHSLFRFESELNTILFAGFPGLVSKLWLGHDQRGFYRGVYQWDGPDLAVAYARALWLVLAVVSEADSIRYVVLPGLGRDEFLADPARADGVTTDGSGWWRPVAGGMSPG